MRASMLLAGVLAASALSAGTAGGREPHFRYERQVVPGAAGPNRLEPDAALLGGGLTLGTAPIGGLRAELVLPGA